MVSKKRVIKNIIILILIVILMLFIGISYAFFSNHGVSVTNTISAGKLSIDYHDGQSISASGLYPILEDDISEKAYSYSFSLTNSGTSDIMAEINLNIVEINDNLKDSNVKYILLENNFQIAEGNFLDINTGEVIKLKDEDYYSKKATKEYILYVYIEESGTDQSNLMNGNMSLNISVEARTISLSSMIAQTDNYFWLPEYRDNITSVDFMNNINLDNAITLSNGDADNYWDLSTNRDKSIIGWLEEDTEFKTDDTIYYKLYIGTNNDYIFGNYNCGNLFYNFKNVKQINFGKVFRTDKVTRIAGMFQGCNSLTTLDVSKFDTSNVNTMWGMFRGCNSLTTLDVSKFDTSNVNTMWGMFDGCNSLTTLDVSKFDTSNVNNMWSMFNGCNLLTTLDVSKFDTSSVTNMGGMFAGCNSLTTLDVSKFDTSNVTSMQSMFNGCNLLTTLDVSKFDTSSVNDMGSMFYGCNLLTTLDVSKFDTSNVNTMWGMFDGCNSLTTLDVGKFNTSNVTNMDYMFGGCRSLTTLDLSSFDISKVTSKHIMLAGTNNVIVAYAKDEESAQFFNEGTYKPASYEFVVKQI